MADSEQFQEDLPPDRPPLPRRRPRRPLPDDEDDDYRLRPRDDGISTLIPYKNVRALVAYYFGVFSLIPCLGALLGPAALILGILGLRFVSANPSAKGTGHAVAGVVLGALTALANWAGIVILLVGLWPKLFK